MYYVRARVNGKLIKRSLNTAVKTIAQQRARQILDDAKGGKWEEVEAKRSRRAERWATVGELHAAYLLAAETHAARNGSPRPRTIRENLSNLSNLVGPGWENKSTATLSADWIEGVVGERLDKSSDKSRSRTTLASRFIKLRSIFSKWALADYTKRGLNLPPCIEELMKAVPVTKPNKIYRLPPPDLVKKTITEGRRLKDDAPELYVAFLACYDLGLRAGEAAAMRWDWFRAGQRDSVFLDVVERESEDFRPKGRERSIPIHPDVWAQLNELSNGTPYVLSGPTLRSRHDLVTRKLAGWMRGIGWSTDKWVKCAHELRKLIGSRWFTEIGPTAAQEWLGHVDISTTCRFYATLLKQPDPLPPAQE
jgi:integrase